MSLNPAEMYGINAGKLAENGAADLVVFDPDKEWRIEKFASKSQNSPFKDQILKGKIELTMCHGKILYSEMEQNIQKRRKEIKSRMKKKCVGVVRSAQELAMDIYDLWIETEIAADAKPGQFVGVFPSKDSTLLPRPISICEANCSGLQKCFEVI